MKTTLRLVLRGRFLFMVFLASLVMSIPLSAQWVQTNGPSYVRSFAVSGTNLFAGTVGGGVFLSTNNGTSWTAVNTGLTNISVWSLAVSGTNLFDGTYRGGLWRRPLSEMITAVENPSTDLPTHFILSQNYPNPFNPATEISYDLPKRSHVLIAVFDVLGRNVGTLVNEEEAAGRYRVTFNASELPSGVYFYRIEAGTYHDTKKLLLLK
ncbi:MAG: T9SS type A sorting domain-containing protein [Bacteroidetes bacterium]|nr:T9SS type A sorting domain-containing protein [Bacteroidota bacterium]MCL5737682.1 T9SS type A sorting domain-containing protein [Bacteroidota bacterium]